MTAIHIAQPLEIFLSLCTCFCEKHTLQELSQNATHIYHTMGNKSDENLGLNSCLQCTCCLAPSAVDCNGSHSDSKGTVLRQFYIPVNGGQSYAAVVQSFG